MVHICRYFHQLTVCYGLNCCISGKQGYLHHLNQNHLHDISKFMFAFSIFWTYLWFAQFLLIWYANLPEEVVYFMLRQDYYKTLFIVNFLINFVLPFLILMTRDSKRQLFWMSALGITLLSVTGLIPF